MEKTPRELYISFLRSFFLGEGYDPARVEEDLLSFEEQLDDLVVALDEDLKG